jgi:hypothetical protein
MAPIAMSQLTCNYVMVIGYAKRIPFWLLRTHKILQAVPETMVDGIKLVFGSATQESSCDEGVSSSFN